MTKMKQIEKDAGKAHDIASRLDGIDPQSGFSLGSIAYKNKIGDKKSVDIHMLLREGLITKSDIDTYVNGGGTGIPEIKDPHTAFLGLAKNEKEVEELVKNGATIQQLLDAGVTPEDFQAVSDSEEIGKNRLMFSIAGGSTMTALANAAKTVTGKPQGKCHSGVKAIYKKAGYNCLDNAGGSGYMCHGALDKSGRFISISFPNASYGNCQKGQFMIEKYFVNFKAGTTLTMDNIEDREIRQKVIAIGKKKGKRYEPGANHGHDCVIEEDDTGKAACDGVQNNIYVNHYGPLIHASFPKDAYVPQQYAELLLQRSRSTISRELAEELLTISMRRQFAEATLLGETNNATTPQMDIQRTAPTIEQLRQYSQYGRD